MSAKPIIVPGVVKPDGTLELAGRIPLPAGQVRVILQPVPELPKGDPFFEMIRGIWAAQDARGHVPRSAEQVEAERRQMRQEWDERMQHIERVQAEARRSRE